MDIRQQVFWTHYHGYEGFITSRAQDSHGSNGSNINDECCTGTTGTNSNKQITRRKPRKRSKQQKHDGFGEVENRQKDDSKQSENSLLAKQVIVFLLNGINYHFEFPVA